MKKLKTKHLRKINIYKGNLNEMEIKEYVASYCLGLKTRSISSISEFLQTPKKDDFSIANTLKTIYMNTRSDRRPKFRKLKRTFLVVHSVLNKSHVGYSYYDYRKLRQDFVSIVSENKDLENTFKAKKEQILSQYNLNKVTKPSQLFQGDKKSYIGLELEFFSNSSNSQIASRLIKNRVKNTSLGSDASIRPDNDEQGSYELRALIENSPKILDEEIYKITKALSDSYALVNQSCGLHVHLDMRHKTKSEITSIIKRLSNCLDVLKYLVPTSRRSNSYCQIGVSKRSGSRYYAVNLLSLKKYNTLEIRLHSGTVDYKKIRYWIDLLNIICNTKNGTKFNTLDEMIEKLKIPDYLAEFYYSRYKKFNKIVNCEDSTESSDESSVETLNQQQLAV